MASENCEKEHQEKWIEKIVLISFESGHYKKLKGEWKGDSVWFHWIKSDGKKVHVNKDKIEYIEEL